VPGVLRRRAAAALVLIVAIVGGAAGLAAAPAAADELPAFRRIHFPVEGRVTFGDDYGDPRSGGRSHEGNDLMGAKLQPLLSAVDGRVTSVRLEAAGLSGNMVIVADAEGWSYRYIHLNNDSPGTDDGANPLEWVVAAGITVGAKVTAGQVLGYMGDSGNAEGTAPHLHFEMRRPDGTAVNPWTSLRLASGQPAGPRCAYPDNPPAVPRPQSAAGYWVLGGRGEVWPFGAAAFHGSVAGMRLTRPIVGMAATPSGKGYWLVASDGGIFAFGDAAFHGSTGAIRLNRPIVGMAATPSGKGYWLVASDGGIFAFGDAAFHGSTGAITLNRPVTSMAPTATGAGYWLTASDGGIFAFGDAAFAGSVPGLGIDTTVVSMAPTGRGGYWLLAADGGVFSFGDAVFRGSVPGLGLCRPPAGVRLVATPGAGGYWVLGGDGSVWALGDAPFHGSVTAAGASRGPAIDLAVVPGAPTPAR